MDFLQELRDGSGDRDDLSTHVAPGGFGNGIFDPFAEIDKFVQECEKAERDLNAKNDNKMLTEIRQEPATNVTGSEYTDPNYNGKSHQTAGENFVAELAESQGWSREVSFRGGKGYDDPRAIFDTCVENYGESFCNPVVERSTENLPKRKDTGSKAAGRKSQFLMPVNPPNSIEVEPRKSKQARASSTKRSAISETDATPYKWTRVDNQVTGKGQCIAKSERNVGYEPAGVHHYEQSAPISHLNQYSPVQPMPTSSSHNHAHSQIYHQRTKSSHENNNSAVLGHPGTTMESYQFAHSPRTSTPSYPEQRPKSREPLAQICYREPHRCEEMEQLMEENAALRHQISLRDQLIDLFDNEAERIIGTTIENWELERRRHMCHQCQNVQVSRQRVSLVRQQGQWNGEWTIENTSFTQ